MDEKSGPITGNDWNFCPDATPQAKLTTPSFIRLFVIRRIVVACVVNDYKDEEGWQNAIENLVGAVDNLQDNNNKQEQKARKLLFRLVKYGLSKYMKEYYDENKHGNLIETIFEKIILINYEKEYQNVSTYNYVNNNTTSQTQLFNANDLMSLIFQWLSFNDLVKCSLVSSHFFYHSFDPKSIYYGELTRLIALSSEEIDELTAKKKQKEKKERKHKHKNKNKSKKHKNNDDDVDSVGAIQRQWQRFINVKRIELHLSNRRSRYSDDSIDFLFEKFLLLSNIEEIKATIMPDQFKTLQGMINKNASKILKYDIIFNRRYDYNSAFGHKYKYLLSPLELINGKIINITSLYFSIKWSNKCKHLIIDNLSNIDNKWCQYIIQHCDCSGIECLEIVDMTFELDNQLHNAATKDREDSNNGVSSINSDLNLKSTKRLIKEMALKFSNSKNFKQLKISVSTPGWQKQYYSCLLLFWSFLKDIINKNKIYVEFNALDSSIERFEKSKTALGNDFNLKDISRNINTINVKFRRSADTGLHFETVGSIIKQSENLEYICLLDCNIDVIKSLINILNERRKNDERILKTLKGIELLPILNRYTAVSDCSISMNLMNNFFNSNVIINANKNENELFIIIHFAIEYKKEKATFYKDFSYFCESIHSLLIKKQIAMDIIIEFEGGMNESDSEFHNDYYDIYQSYFDEEQLKNEYKLPKCNQYCKPLQSVKTSFAFEIVTFSYENPVFRIANVCKTDKCMQFREQHGDLEHNWMV